MEGSMTGADFPQHIFRAYDIRGTYETEVTDSISFAIGWAFGRMIRERVETSSPLVSVGMDARLHSPALKDAFMSGLHLAGCRIMDLGLCPSPLTYYSAFKLGPDAFAMITASHNPPEDNGFKLGIGRDTIHSEDMQLLGRMARSAPPFAPAEVTPEVEEIDIISLYVEEIVGRFTDLPEILTDIGRPVKIVIDSGNGTAGPVLPEIMRRLGFEIVEMFSEPDGRFPNHHPDPTLPEAMEALREAIRAAGADVGVALDGDADRIGLLDENGNVIWGDMLLLILARDIIEAAGGRGGDEHPLIISEVKASQVLYDEVEKYGGSALMWKTGHSLIKAKMKETGAALAGEVSGHLFFADRYYGYDDGLYAAVRLAEVYARSLASGKITSFSQLLDGVPKVFNTPEIRIPCPETEKTRIISRVAEALARHKKDNEKPAVRRIVDIDGVRAVFDGGWGLVRFSNTQPVLVMRFEARDQPLLDSYQSFFRHILAEVTERSP
ncbi:phosphomannomutase/phosphoglucomutase [bacterium BMS3Abin14]|nr:phosphomannomutase/phosphoglucomutase [bacterium BMS3Abin14]